MTITKTRTSQSKLVKELFQTIQNNHQVSDKELEKRIAMEKARYSTGERRLHKVYGTTASEFLQEVIRHHEEGYQLHTVLPPTISHTFSSAFMIKPEAVQRKELKDIEKQVEEYYREELASSLEKELERLPQLIVKKQEELDRLQREKDVQELVETIAALKASLT